MEIIIKGSPKELAELLAGLRTEQPAEEKKGAPQSETAERQENKVLSREEAKEIVNVMNAVAKETLKFLYHTL